MPSSRPFRGPQGPAPLLQPTCMSVSRSCASTYALSLGASPGAAMAKEERREDAARARSSVGAAAARLCLRRCGQRGSGEGQPLSMCAREGERRRRRSRENEREKENRVGLPVATRCLRFFLSLPFPLRPSSSLHRHSVLTFRLRPGACSTAAQRQGKEARTSGKRSKRAPSPLPRRFRPPSSPCSTINGATPAARSVSVPGRRKAPAEAAWLRGFCSAGRKERQKRCGEHNFWREKTKSLLLSSSPFGCQFPALARLPTAAMSAVLDGDDCLDADEVRERLPLALARSLGEGPSGLKFSLSRSSFSSHSLSSLSSKPLR